VTPEQYITTALTDLADVYGPEMVYAHARLLWAPPEPSQPSRVTDPDTSHASGARMESADVGRFRLTSRAAALLIAIDKVDDENVRAGLTAQEATISVMGVDCPPSRFDGCRRRVSDLLRAGYIEDSGTRRSNTGSPDESIVWQVTELGRAAIVSLYLTGWSRGRA
jgi:hypothetical protein